MARIMDRTLKQLVSEDRFEFYKVVSDFSEKKIATQILDWERGHTLIPDNVIKEMGEMGLFGLTTSEEYGGAGGSHTDLVLMGLALGYHSQSVAITPGAATSLGTKPLQLCGTDAQKAEHLSDLSSGSRMFVFGLSEPGRGSDAASPEVTAEKIDGGWRIKGEKCWSTNAHWASHVVVHALTDSSARHGHQSTCFIVPMNAKGVSYQEMSGKEVWLQSSTGSISFDNVEVSDADVLGEVNEGFKVMVTTLNGGRLFIAGLALASLGAMLDKCAQYTQERIQFENKAIGRFQRIQDVILDMDIALEQGLTWLFSLLGQYESGAMHRESAAKVKIECSRRASDLATLAMEICGGVSCLDEFGLMRHFRDLFVTRVGEGSNFALKTMSVAPLLSDIKKDLQ